MDLRHCAAVLLAGAVVSSAFSAEMKVKPSTAFQMTKKAAVATEGNIDDAFVRAEVKLSGKLDKGVHGLAHLRLESRFANDKDISLKIRQCYLAVPVSIVTMQGGRWYETYTAGYYFGRFLFGVKKNLGSGSMNTNYNVVDGFRLQADIEKIKTSFHAAVLSGKYVIQSAVEPWESDEWVSFDDVSTMLRISSEPIEGLKLGVGGLVHTLVPDGSERMDRLDVHAGYRILEKLALSVEYGMTDLSDVSQNSWFLFVLEVPAWKILDRLQLEVEYKQKRNGVDTRQDAAWMVLLRKKWRGVTVDLNVGADPQSLKSLDAGDIGGTMRTTLKF